MKDKAVGMKVLKAKKDQKVVACFPSTVNRSGRFMDSFVMMQRYDAFHNRRIIDGGGYVPVTTSIVAQARNEIVRVFLEQLDADWLWFIDTDMTFDEDIVDRLVEAAHPRDRPIMGALCFSLQSGYRAVPTLYVIRPDGKVGNVFEYAASKVIRTLTGTGCILIHRTVFEKMRDATKPDGTPKYPKPYEWFHNTAFGEKPVGEDITFCIRAEALGMPVHVDTSIKCGHEKPFIVDETMYLAQKAAGIRDIPDLIFPTFVVIAAKNRHDMTYNLLSQLDETATVFLTDNGSEPEFEVPAGMTMFIFDCDSWPLHKMWNQGMNLAADAAKDMGADKWNVAILNNDLEVPPGFLPALESGIRADDNNWVSYPNYHGAEIPDGHFAVTKSDIGDGRTLSGWAFMIRGETGLRFDEQFAWWYGDADIQRQAEAAGKNVVCVGGCYCNHLEPNKSTQQSPERIAQAIEDEARFAAKWGLDPSTLILAKNKVTV